HAILITQHEIVGQEHRIEPKFLGLFDHLFRTQAAGADRGVHVHRGDQRAERCLTHVRAPGETREHERSSQAQDSQARGRTHAIPLSRNASSYTASTAWTIAGIPNLAPMLWLAAAPSSLAQSGRES